MNTVYICACATAAAALRASDILHRMSPARRKRYDDTSSQAVRLEALASQAALDGALSRAIPDYSPPAPFSYAPGGRPIVPGAHISIAHTRGMAVCAAGDIPVGIDIEHSERAISDALKRRVLSSRDDALRPLIMTWVDKEAYLKLTGEGLAGGMERCFISGARVQSQNGMPPGHLSRVTFDGYLISVCCHDEFLLAPLEFIQ